MRCFCNYRKLQKNDRFDLFIGFFFITYIKLLIFATHVLLSIAQFIEIHSQIAQYVQQYVLMV